MRLPLELYQGFRTAPAEDALLNKMNYWPIGHKPVGRSSGVPLFAPYCSVQGSLNRERKRGSRRVAPAALLSFSG